MRLNFEQLVELNNHVESVKGVLIEYDDFTEEEAKEFVESKFEGIKKCYLAQINPFDTVDRLM